MKLHWSPRSPYVRKVMILAHELGLADQIERVRSVTAMDTPNRDLMRDNPLSKIPTLVLDDGTAIFDSLSICNHLRDVAGAPKRSDPLGVDVRHSLCNGLTDVIVLWRNERDKPIAQQRPEWISAFSTKVTACLDRLEATAAAFRARSIDVDQAALASCLAYADFRLPLVDWRRDRSGLASWLADFSTRPSFKATEITDG